MSRRILSVVLLIPFGALSLYALLEAGYIGIWAYQFHSAAGWQVLADLVVACVLLLTWIVPEARQRGINPWPFVLLTLFLGSFGPLLYLALHGGRKHAA